MKNVLITGANGFIGQRLGLYLLKQGLNVKGTIRTSMHGPSGIKPIIVKDLCHDKTWLSSLEGIDTIYHLAAQTHDVKAGKLNDASYTTQRLYPINIDVTQDLAQAAIKFGVKRFVYMSSIKVNGETTQELPFSSLDFPKPEDNYGRSKHQAEVILKQLSKDSKLEVVIIRPPLVYGPHVKGNFLSLLRICDTGLPLPFAAIQNQRSLIYVENLISVLYACGISPQAAGHTFLVRDKTDISTSHLIYLIRQYMERSIRLFPCPLKVLNLAAIFFNRQEAINRLSGSLQIDDSNVREILKWSPPISLEEGLKTTVAWFKSQKNTEQS